MSSTKKRVRQQFRESVFARDGHACRICSRRDALLDAHHITDRNEMPCGGYALENGISLCPECHERAEAYHRTGTALPGFAPSDLYARIGSSHAAAVAASERLL